MIYCCVDCSFLFQRVGEIQECPSCDGSRIRSATPEETERLQSRLKTIDDNDNNETGGI